MSNKVIPIHNVSQDKKAGGLEPLPRSPGALYELPWQEYLRRKNYNKDENSMCVECQKEQIRKYGKITIECDGPRLATEKVPQEILDNLTEEESSIVASLYDPYLYAELNLDVDRPPEKRFFSKRWYQKFITNCSAKRKVVRCGRRVGKSYSLALDIWFRMTTIPNYKVLVVTPFLTQAKELADLVRKMLRNSSDRIGSWDDIVEASRISPVHEIVLKNGSVFKAFTAGGGDASSVRGQGADLIILDEADFLSQESFNSIIAIMADNPNVDMICTSTPYGENILYKLSKTPEYKEFHFPTFVLPHYNDKLDEDFRNGTDMAGYIQEVQAEFGIDNAVVFQPEFIYDCQEKRETESGDFLKYRGRYILSLGCDWNGDRVGTRICIIAFDKNTGEIEIVRLDNVQKEGWTQTAAVQKIIELNRLYDLDHIYVDEGFGQSNVQQLKLHAINNYGKLPENHPDLKLDQVVAVNFASTLELRDVVTNEIRKKYYKNFMVETVTRALENRVLNLSGKKSLPIIEQMKNYVVKSTTTSGRKIYEAKISEIGDHDLDAYMLAVLSIHMEHDSILDKRIFSEVQIVPIEKPITEDYNENFGVERRHGGGAEDFRSGLFSGRKHELRPTNRTRGLKSSGRADFGISPGSRWASSRRIG